MREVYRFGDDAWSRPRRAWAEAWVRGAEQYWPQVIHDYRERVREYYDDQFARTPTAFGLMSPTALIIVVSLARSWVFTGPADADEVSIVERWEDSVLATPKIRVAPNHEATARAELAISEEFRLLESDDMVQAAASHGRDSQPLDPFRMRRLPGIQMQGWDLADSDAAVIELSHVLSELRNRRLDEEKLEELSDELARLEQIDDAAERGRLFEAFMEELLRAHGCDVERGKGRSGEQIDLFVHRPFRALAECRWTSAPIGAPDVALLISKLKRNRPSVVSGIYFSMAGWTDPAATEASHHAYERVVLLFGPDEIRNLVDGSQHVADLVEQSIDAIVRRY